MSNLIYANARAKAMEKNLLGSEGLNRMIESATPDDAIKILSEVGFGDGLILDSALEFERLISAEQKKLFSFLKEASSPQNFARFILLKNDYHNAEAFIKGKHLRIDVDGMTVDSGTLDKDWLKEKIITDDYKDLSEQMANALLLCDNEFVGGRASGLNVNVGLTRAYYDELYKIAVKDKYLRKIYTFRVDSLNIGTALRTRNYSQYLGMALSNGSLTEREVKSLCEIPLENLKEQFRYTEYKTLIETAVEEKLKGQPLSDFEKFGDNFAIKLLKKDKYEIEGALPLMLYTYSRLSEISNVRIILVGLINGIDKTDIKRKLREIYEG